MLSTQTFNLVNPSVLPTVTTTRDQEEANLHVELVLLQNLLESRQEDFLALRRGDEPTIWKTSKKYDFNTAFLFPGNGLFTFVSRPQMLRYKTNYIRSSVAVNLPCRQVT